MKNRHLHRALYQLKHRFFTLNNIVIGVAILIAAGWVWGSLGVMQRNYSLQRTIDQKSQELLLAELETRSLELEREYYKTREYQELAVRERLGKGTRGESVLIIPRRTPITDANVSPEPKGTQSVQTNQPSNFEQWMDFLFGGGE